jgi:hypothetical protein
MLSQCQEAFSREMVVLQVHFLDLRPVKPRIALCLRGGSSNGRLPS